MNHILGALSNIEKFFEHLRENIEALQSTDGAAERSQRSNDGPDQDNPSEDSTGISWENSAELPSVLSTSYRGGGKQRKSTQMSPFPSFCSS